jgi:hypothetical protein
VDCEKIAPVLDQMPLGVTVAGVVLGLVWSFGWQHYIRYWVRSGPPHRRSVEVGFRIFFFMCFAGSAWQFAEQIVSAHGPSGTEVEFGVIDGLIIVAVFSSLTGSSDGTGGTQKGTFDRLWLLGTSSDQA